MFQNIAKRFKLCCSKVILFSCYINKTFHFTRTHYILYLNIIIYCLYISQEQSCINIFVNNSSVKKIFICVNKSFIIARFNDIIQENIADETVQLTKDYQHLPPSVLTMRGQTAISAVHTALNDSQVPLQQSQTNKFPPTSETNRESLGEI